MSIRAIVLDDNTLLLKVWQKLLDNGTSSSLVTNDPALAFKAMEEHPIDVVVCDIVMPQIDGLEFAKRARQLHPGLPIVLTTAYPCKFEDMILGLGPSDVFFLPKPYVDVKRLKTVIEQLITPRNPANESPYVKTMDGTPIHLLNLAA